MNESAISLDRLHDLVVSPNVPWWPFAPGWYFVFATLLVFGVVLLIRKIKSWRQNAYRRAALDELSVASDSYAIAEILRRTALAIAPRSFVAEKTDANWVDWLASSSPETMSDSVRKGLTNGVYSNVADGGSIETLRDFARSWIKHHQVPGVDLK